ncbi:UBX (ubiquitin regulatory X) domain protein [Ceratobasidium sp. AG-Ba]|nr:UBX (ubiquitin regulatory X) domain protein [Ceratobasidium sp. AG-Ba]
MTQQMRDRQNHERLKKWPNCTIRVRFHNQMQLERSFPSTNKIKAVYAFVRDCLNEEARSIKFVLYQPPARELKVSDATVRDQTLLELQLAPASVLLLRFLSDELNEDREKLPPLQPSILAAAENLPEPMVHDEDLGAAPKSTSTKTSTNVEQKLAKFLKLPAHK